MGLELLLEILGDVKYSPRTLSLTTPEGLTNKLSVFARAFLHEAFDTSALTAINLTSGEWRKNPAALRSFKRCDPDTQDEIIAFLTVFIHEYTHRVDFLISPFGLQYYANSLREYWLAQEFFPRVLDDPQTVGYVRNLASFRANFTKDGFPNEALASYWNKLEELIHHSYAWGDAGGVDVPAQYVTPVATDVVAGDVLGVGATLEPVTVFRMFFTYRQTDQEGLWYLRPMTILETKALVNSFLFILHCLGPEGQPTALRYYERVYLNRRDRLKPDYFFLLDMGARIFGHDDFRSLLRTGPELMVRSTLVLLSGVCWFALQAPPHLKDEHPSIGNPVLRLVEAFRFVCRVTRREIAAPGESIAEILLWLERHAGMPLKPIEDVLRDCVRVIDNMIDLNRERTWNPEVREYFDKVFGMMRPHFANRKPNYVSEMGMPDNGNPLAGCRTKDDWEVIYDDNVAPAAAKEWFDVRGDLFFGLLRPTPEVVAQLDRHYQAFLVPHQCPCGHGITMQWCSRFARVFELECGFCGKKTEVRREEMRIIAMPGE